MSGYGNFASVYDQLITGVDYRQIGEYFDACIRKAGGGKGILLDLGCGTGSLSMVMDELGYDVIGVDGSYEMLGEAMEKRAQSGRDILYLAQDMTELDLFGTVGAVVSSLDSLNHLTRYADFDRAVGRAALFLEPGGVMAFDVNTPYKHRQVLADNTFVYDTDEVYCVWQNTADGDLTRMDLDLFVRQEDGAYIRMEDHFSERAYSREEIEASLTRHGMEVVGVYDAWTFDPPRPDSERLVFVARMVHSRQSRPEG